MLLVLTSPSMTQQFRLDKSVTAENAIGFSLEKGELSLHSVDDGYHDLQFYWHFHEPLVVNHSSDFICLVNGKELDVGEHHLLSFGTEIQFGPVNITVDRATSQQVEESFAHNLFMLAESGEAGETDLPEIEDILSHGGHYISYFDAVDETQEYGQREPDVLKQLEVEYKRFLLWGEQAQQSQEILVKDQPQVIKLSGRDEFLDNIRERVKDKTLTECILDSGGLIDKVTQELSIFNYLDTQDDDTRIDLLKELAPEHFITKEKNSVPSLMFQELYKLGLDSHL
jgi:hypothetical protein